MIAREARLLDQTEARVAETGTRSQTTTPTLYELAFREKAFAATVELQWFLTEQLEEVSSMDNLLKILERASALEARRQGKYMFKLAGGSDFPDPLPAYEEYAC